MQNLPRWLYLVVALFWAAALGTDALRFFLDPQFAAIGVEWDHFIFKHGMTAAFWAVVTIIALVWYAERPLFGLGIGRGLVRVATWTVLGCMVYAAYFVGLLNVLTRGEVSWARTFEILGSHTLLYGALTTWEIGLATNGYHYYRRSVRQQQQSVELRTKLAETEVVLLRAQLEPHFLFNALNSIAALVRLQQNARAVEAVGQLSALLRGMLEVGQRSLMPWSWEKRFTNMYVELQKLRFEDRLEISIDADGVGEETQLPACLLQPLIENSIRHGPLEQARRCAVVVRLRSVAERTRIWVTNAVSGTAPRAGHGMGLANLEARLRAIYADDFTFRAERRGDRFEVEIDLGEVMR